MPAVATCPRCKSELALPADANGGAQAECPICQVEFSLAAVATRMLPEARLVNQAAFSSLPPVESPPAAASARAEHTSREPVEANGPPVDDNLSRLMRATSTWSAAHEDESHPADLEAPIAPSSEEEPARAAENESAVNGLKLGSSRLDQLLSDLMKSSTAARSDPEQTIDFAESESAEAAVASYETASVEEPLATDFDSELPEFDDSDEQDEVSWSPSDEQGVTEIPPQELRTAPRRRRRPSAIRTLIGVVGGGMFGLLLGAYGLLWLKGAAGDVAGLSKWLPPSLLPPSMRQIEKTGDVSDADSRITDEKAAQQGGAPVPEQPAPATRFDPAVTAASGVEPIAPPNTTSTSNTGSHQTRQTASPAATVWPTTPLVRDLRGVHLYSLAQFREVLPAAEKALPIFLAGNLANQESWSKMGPAYMSLCALAERFTLTDPAAYGQDLIAAQGEARRLFSTVLSDRARRGDLTLIASRWLEHDRRQNQGVIFAGRVLQARRDGAWTKYTLEVSVEPTEATAVVLTDQAEFAANDEIAVVGAIIPQPRDHLVGFHDADPQVILAGYVNFLDEMPIPAASGSRSPH